VAVCLFEDLAEGDEGLDIAARTYDLNDDVQLRWWSLARLTAETWGDVGWR
jgi:hypothetical protein